MIGTDMISDNYSSMSGHLEAKRSIKDEDFWMASLEATIDDSSTLGKNVPRCIGRLHFVSRRRRRRL